MHFRKGKEALAALSRLLVGSALLIAGLQKAGQSLAFGKALENYDLLPLSILTPVALVIPWMEIVVGVYLLLGLRVRWAAKFALLLAVGFGIFVGSALARGLNVECGCFSGPSQVSFVHLGIDGLLVALAISTIVWGPDRWTLDRWMAFKEVSPSKQAMAAFAVLGILSALYAAVPEAVPPQSGQAPISVEGPTLILDPPTLDLGFVREGDTVHRGVVYRNPGTEPVKIVWVQSSCGCTAPQPGKRKLAGGESGELKVGYHAPSTARPIQQSIKIYLAGVTDPVILQVVGEVSAGD